MSPQFGIVFDAGSSHTSLFVYQWPADKENNTGVVSQALACQVEGQWALDSQLRGRRKIFFQPSANHCEGQELTWEK